MKQSEKTHNGSLFKRYFIQITATVLLCLTITSLAILFFSTSFWKSDRLTSLRNDALRLTQSVSSILGETGESFQEEMPEKKYLIEKLISAVADSAESEIFIVDSTGHIMLCYDAEKYADGSNFSDVICPQHKDYVFPDYLLEAVNSEDKDYYEYNGKLDSTGKEDYFMVAVPVMLHGERCFVVAMQAESVAYLPYTAAFLRILLTVGIIAIIISFIISLSVSLTMTKPLKTLTEATSHFARGDFSVRINASESYNELTELVDAVNIMAKDLAVLEESRSSFVANISHELKTPMTTISGFVDGLLDGTIPDEDRDKYLTIVSNEVKRLSRLVVAMLNMSKIEAGKLELNLTDFNMTAMLTKTLLSFEKSVEDKNILVLGCDSFDKVIIRGDEALINQILYNLIDNAVKFTPDGGTITLMLENNKKNAVFSIRNTGKGISEEDCKLIFDRFYKVDKSRGLDAKSFGLGLYIVKSIIELHKGTINLNSEVGRFTEFTIELPLQ